MSPVEKLPSVVLRLVGDLAGLGAGLLRDLGDALLRALSDLRSFLLGDRGPVVSDIISRKR